MIHSALPVLLINREKLQSVFLTLSPDNRKPSAINPARRQSCQTQPAPGYYVAETVKLPQIDTCINLKHIRSVMLIQDIR